MGAKPAFNPELIPMKNRPMMIISKEPAAFEAPARELHGLTWLDHEKAMKAQQRKETEFCTFKDGRNRNQHIVQQESALPAEPLRHNTGDGASYHTPHTEDSHSNGPDDGHFGLVHYLTRPVVLCDCDPFLYELQQRRGTCAYPMRSHSSTTKEEFSSIIKLIYTEHLEWKKSNVIYPWIIQAAHFHCFIHFHGTVCTRRAA
jgi:hypothetical protein